MLQRTVPRLPFEESGACLAEQHCHLCRKSLRGALGCGKGLVGWGHAGRGPSGGGKGLGVR